MTDDDAQQLLVETASAPGSLPREAADELLRHVGRHWPASFQLPAAAIAGLTGRPAELSARDWHLQGLEDALAAWGRHNGGAAIDARIRYHTGWLLYLADPSDKAAPKVSVVIPIYNRAWLAAGVVRNALDQAYPNLEVIVVDDGSTDGLEAALAPYRHRIQLLRQENRGVSAARNAGISAATGELVQFLDADNLLVQDCIAAKMRCFQAIPDAELCYSGATEVALFGVPGAVHQYKAYFPDPEEVSPVQDLLSSFAQHGYPFLVCSVLIPRWVLLETGAFDANLRRGEDNRYWWQLGLRGSKVIGVRRRLFYRALMGDGLHVAPRTLEFPLIRACNLTELLARPARWSVAAQDLATWAGSADFRCLVEEHSDPAIQSARSHLFEALERLGQQAADEARSPVLLLAFIWACLQDHAIYDGESVASTLDARRALATRVAAIVRTLPPPAELERREWREMRLPNRALRVLQIPPEVLERSEAKLREALVFLQQETRFIDSGLSACPVKPVAAAFRPVVTFVVPVLQSPQEAERTILSCLEQDFARAEILVLEQEQPARPWSDRSERVRTVALPDPVPSLAYAWNVGVSQARSRLVRLLRPGQELDRSSVSRQVAVLRNLDARHVACERDAADDSALLEFLLAKGAPPNLSAMLIPRKLFFEVGGFDAILGEAHEQRYLLRLAAAGASVIAAGTGGTIGAGPTRPDMASATLCALANLADALRLPRLWPCLPRLARDLGGCEEPARAGNERRALLHMLTDHVVAIVRELAAARRRDAVSPINALALCLAGLEWGRSDLGNGAVSDSAASVRDALMHADLGYGPRQDASHGFPCGALRPEPLRRAAGRAALDLAVTRSKSPLGHALRSLASATG